MVSDVRFTFGAVLGGAYIATAQVLSDYLLAPLTFLSFSLSGVLCVQAFLYFRNYPRDSVYLKAMVRLNACMVCSH